MFSNGRYMRDHFKREAKMSTIQQRNVTMQFSCAECGRGIELPLDSVSGELISCPDCGQDFEIVSVDSARGAVETKPALLEAEDWGE